MHRSRKDGGKKFFKSGRGARRSTSPSAASEASTTASTTSSVKGRKTKKGGGPAKPKKKPPSPTKSESALASAKSLIQHLVKAKQKPGTKDDQVKVDKKALNLDRKNAKGETPLHKAAIRVRARRKMSSFFQCFIFLGRPRVGTRPAQPRRLSLHAGKSTS